VYVVEGVGDEEGVGEDVYVVVDDAEGDVVGDGVADSVLDDVAV